MARQIPTGSIHSNVLLAHNETHAVNGGSTVHNDGPEFDQTGAELLIAPATVVTWADAVNVFNSARAVFADHLSRYSTVVPLAYAHKAADPSTISTAAMSAASVYSDPILAALITLVAEETTRYNAHISSAPSLYHIATDMVDVLGSVETMVTWGDVAERLNLIKINVNLHMVSTTYHGAADSSTVISAPNASETDFDSCIILANAIRTGLNAHFGHGPSIHSSADTADSVTGSAVTYVGGMFTLGAELQTKWGAHFASSTYHNTADGAAALSAPAPTTVSTAIAAAQEIATKGNAHMNHAPGSRALRFV